MEQTTQWLNPREYGALWRLLRGIRYYRPTLRASDLLPKGTNWEGETHLTQEEAQRLTLQDFSGGLERYLELVAVYLKKEEGQKDQAAGGKACRELVEMWMGELPVVKSGPLRPFFDQQAEAATELEAMDDWYRFHQLLVHMEELIGLLSSRYAERVVRSYCSGRSRLHQANLRSSLYRTYGQELERQVIRLFLLPPRVDRYNQGFREELFAQIAKRCAR